MTPPVSDRYSPDEVRLSDVSWRRPHRVALRTAEIPLEPAGRTGAGWR